MRLVIIGLGTSGFAAMLAAKKTNPSIEITVIDPKDFDLLHLCGIPYAIGGELELDSLKHSLGLEEMGVKQIKGKAVKVDARAKLVEVDNGEKVEYDKLLIAPGSTAFIPPVEGKELVYTIAPLENTIKFKEAAEKAKYIAVIGAGAAGLETAVELAKKGKDVSVIEMAPRLLPNMTDTDMSDLLKKKLEEKGIHFYIPRGVERIAKRYVLAEGGKSVKADVVLMAAGARPVINFLDKSGILHDKSIIVNNRMQTNFEDVYAAGEAAQVKCLINNKPSPSAGAVPAYRQGIIAGINAAGGNAKYKGIIYTFATVLDDIEFASVGFNESLAKANNIEVVFGRVKGTDIASWFPNAKDLIVKVLADKSTGRVIGAQALGNNAAKRIEVVAAAILAGMALEEMQDLELAYCPPVSDTYDVLLAAVEQALRKLKR
jgi:NADH oxidase (H2O2-forming)